MFSPGSRGGNVRGNSNSGSRIPCRYDSTNQHGDLYKCRDTNMRIGGQQGDPVREAVFTREGGRGSFSTTLHETSRGGGLINYGAPELSDSRHLVTVGDSRDSGGNHDFSIDRGSDGFSMSGGPDGFSMRW